jgi:hypothetical protein
MKNIIKIGLLSLAFGAFVTACDDDDVFINTSNIITEITTGDAQVTSTTADVTGTVKDLSSQSASAYSVGVIYSTSEDPTLAGTKKAGTIDANGNVNTSITGLQDGVTYYYATYVTLQGTVSKYGEIKSFVTTDALIGTAAAASVNSVSANLGGTLNGVQDRLEDGSLEYGISLSTTAAGVSTNGVKYTATGSSNSFTVAVDKLVPNTDYYYAAYIVLNGDPIYGNVQQFTTLNSNAVAAEESADYYVDMGTKVEWCKFNVGATSPSEFGGLYGYGDVTGLLRSTEAADYATGDITETSKDIALASNMGKLPTKSDFEDLVAACTVQTATMNGVYGLLFTSNSTGNQLFFPAAGSRNGEAVSQEGVLAAYWTGTADVTNSSYAYVYTANGIQSAHRSVGASVRPVRKPYSNSIAVDDTKIAVGDLEGNGRIRIELYNEYGSTSGNAGFNLDQVSFSQTLAVQFTISGINDNLVEGAAGTYRGGLEFAGNNWGYGYWSDFSGQKYDCIVSGDGTYTAWCETSSLVEGPIVFTVDINGLGADLADISKIAVSDVSIIQDEPFMQSITNWNNEGVVFCSNNDGADARIDVYATWDEPTLVNADLVNSLKYDAGTMTMTFTITGLDGNLVEGAAGSYNADISYAGGPDSWYPSTWGTAAGRTAVTGDGTYRVQAPLSDQGASAAFWAIELYGLWPDVVDTSKVKVTIDEINVPVYHAK